MSEFNSKQYVKDLTIRIYKVRKTMDRIRAEMDKLKKEMDQKEKLILKVVK